MKILQISDGKTGHMNAAKNVIRCLLDACEADTSSIDICEVHFKQKYYGTVLRMVSKIPMLFDWLLKSQSFLRLFYDVSKAEGLDFSSYDFIVSGGGDTAFANIYLARRYHIKNIYVSRLRGLSHDLFYLLVTIYQNERFSNSIVVDFPPLDKQPIEEQKIIKFRQNIHFEKEKRYFTLLLGGDGAGYSYMQEDFISIIDSFLSLLEKHNAYGLLSTSRRTSLQGDAVIQEVLSKHKYASRISYAIFFNQKPEYLLDCFFDASSVIFVSQDSGSMITESILTNKPVYTLVPSNIKNNKLYMEFLKTINRYTKASLDAKALKKLESIEYENDHIESPSAILTQKIKTYLNK
jgi:mitochondrial fission protein ELM1